MDERLQGTIESYEGTGNIRTRLKTITYVYKMDY